MHRALDLLPDLRRRRFHDPVTGDELTWGEELSWVMQGMIRRWTFLGIITVITAFVWIHVDPIWRRPPTEEWNLWASYLALLIEGTVGIAMFSQTRRDAVCLREVRQITRHLEEMAVRQQAIMDHHGIEDPIGGPSA